jgi:hypothetical protein
MSEYRGTIVIGAVLAVALVAGLAVALNSLVPGNSSIVTSTSTSPGSSLTSWFGPESPPAGCGNASTRGGFTGWGYRDDVQSSWPRQGGTACIYTYLQNTGNESTSLPTNESIVVTSYTTPPVVYFQSECVAPPYSGSFGANSSGWNCVALWNTSNGYNATSMVGAPVAAEYQAMVTVHFADSPLVILGGNNIYVERETSATTASSPSGPSCGGPDFKLLTPMQNGSIYLKVVTDQGSVITNNGTVFVTHEVPAASGVSGGKADYCLRLSGNATGYMELAANDGLPQTGSYNMTLAAGYNQGSGYVATIPAFTVPSNATTYVTVSVPSGDVTIVTSVQGSSPVTTTTTATSIKNGG